MKIKQRKISGLTQFGIVIAGLLILFLTTFYNIIFKRPFSFIMDKMLEPLIETLDNEYSGLIIIFCFLVEILLTLIVPWFFGWKIGLMCFIYFVLTFSIFIFLLNEDTKINLGLFLVIYLPYTILLFVPTLIVTIFRKKEEKIPTIIELRISKLKKLKRKVKRNRLKFWKRYTTG